jgi:hypothetical protein
MRDDPTDLQSLYVFVSGITLGIFSEHRSHNHDGCRQGRCQTSSIQNQRKLIRSYFDFGRFPRGNSWRGNLSSQNLQTAFLDSGYHCDIGLERTFLGDQLSFVLAVNTLASNNSGQKSLFPSSAKCSIKCSLREKIFSQEFIGAIRKEEDQHFDENGHRTISRNRFKVIQVAGNEKRRKS